VYYISGPMTGYPEFNFPAFTAKAAQLRAEGKTVISPHELPGEELDMSWDWYLRRDLKALVDCTHVVLLDGWEHSRGANLEVHVARALGMTIIDPVAA
jgi:hypothetical protein